VHLFINQLHVALLHAQNGLVGRLRADGIGDDTVFDEARRALTWHHLPGRPAAQRAERLDGTLPASLIGLPRQVTGEVIDGAYRSLAVRDLLRGEATGLPAGETIAQAMGVPPLGPDEVGAPWPDGTRCGSTCCARRAAAATGNGSGPWAAGSSSRC
jgi:hypothetical protein